MDEMPTISASNLGHEVARLFVAAVACPAMLFLGRWFGLHYPLLFDTNPSALLILLYLCPVYATIAVIAFAWRSRLLFILTSIAVWLVAVVGSDIADTWDWRNAVYATKRVAPTGFFVAIICFAILLCVRWLQTEQRIGIVVQLFCGIALSVAMTWLTLIATG
jgi:hypothetical protein